MVEGTEGSHSHKEGPIKMSKHNMMCAGIDTGKNKLDVAIAGSAERWCFANTPQGHAGLLAWLRAHHVERIGIEASGGYERAVVAEMRGAGFVVIMFQPAQVRSYARFRLQRAKNDKIDAGLVADCTAATETIHAPPDPRLVMLAEHQTLIDQIIEDIATLKNRRESAREKPHRQFWSAQISDLKRKEKDELKKLVAAIRAHDDLARRLDLIASVDGVGLPTAVAILVRLPEIGRVSREEVAALAGLAPYDDDSGERSGAKHIAGGRERLRKVLYNASLAAAYHWNPQLIAFKDRLLAAGKLHKVMRVACARKLLIFVNTVVARGTSWVSSPIPA
jgi:transposase